MHMKFNFLNCRTSKKRGSLDVLNNDILVDSVLCYLEIFDILRLRRVSKLYYDITHHAVLWKRLLHACELPLPPLPPTARHSLENLTALEAERLLVRAHSLDVMWKHTYPDFLDEWEFDSFHRVTQMVLLPGSQYLVASVADTGGSSWSIMVYVLDTRYNVIPIAKTPTTTKAYNLQAKYLTVNGAPGITITYVRRDWRNRCDRRKGIDVSDYSGDHDIDAPYPLKYECHALHAPLKELEVLAISRLVPGSPEFLARAAAQPPPFTQLCMIRSTRALGSIVLDEVEDSPYLILIRYPSSIMFKPLNGGPVSILNIENFGDFADYPHQIKAIRPLPQQRQILVAREIRMPPTHHRYPIFSLEFHPIPISMTSEPHEVTRSPDDFAFFSEDHYSNVYITDHGMQNWLHESIQGEKLGGAEYKAFKPRPINVLFRAVAPQEGLLRMTFYPRRLDNWAPPSPTPSISSSSENSSLKSIRPKYYYRYDRTHVSPVRFVAAFEGSQYRILPGSYRTLLYSVPWDTIGENPTVLGFYRYHDKEIFANEPEATTEGSMIRRPIYTLPYNFDQNLKFGAFAWDETIGRMCYGIQNSTKIRVCDFTKRPKEDLFGRRKPLCVQQEHDEPCSETMDVVVSK